MGDTANGAIHFSKGLEFGVDDTSGLEGTSAHMLLAADSMCTGSNKS